METTIGSKKPIGIKPVQTWHESYCELIVFLVWVIWRLQEDVVSGFSRVSVRSTFDALRKRQLLLDNDPPSPQDNDSFLTPNTLLAPMGSARSQFSTASWTAREERKLLGLMKSVCACDIDFLCCCRITQNIYAFFCGGLVFCQKFNLTQLGVTDWKICHYFLL